MRSLGPAGDLDVIDVGAVADHKLERGVDLVRRPQASWLSTSMARAPGSITTSERVNTEAGREPVAANTRWIGRSAVAPLATRTSAPSRISAVLSATTPSRSGGTTLPRCAASCGSPAAIASAIERMVRPGDRLARSESSGTNMPSTKTMRRASMSPSQLPGAPAHATWPRRRARRRSAWRRASARAGRCISTPRSAGAAGPRPRTTETPLRAAPTPAPSPGSVGLAATNASASACSALVFMLRTSAFMMRVPLRPGIPRSPWLRARARVPCRRSWRCGRARARAPRRARCG